MWQKKQIFTICLMGGLSCMTTQGCIWQYNRYNQSISRWEKINAIHKNFDPLIMNYEFPWTTESINEWEFRLVSLEGYLLPYRNFIKRTRDSRIGYLVFAPLIEQPQNDIHEGVMLCIGWIPYDLKEQFYPDLNKTPQKIKINAIVRKNEAIQENTKKEFIDGVYTHIDLKMMSKLYRLSDKSQIAYLEKIVQEKDLIDGDLYPVQSTLSSIERPYLTPDRHRDYAIFWGTCTMIGIFNILKVLIKR